MNPSTATYVLERAHRGWSVSDQELSDAECMLSDMLESAQSIRRDRSRIHAHLEEVTCRECGATASLSMLPV